MITRNVIEDCVHRAVDKVNLVLPGLDALRPQNETVLIGDGGILDSMGFINFVVSAEEEIAQKLNIDLNVTEELNSRETLTSKPLTVGEFIDVLLELARKRVG